MSTTPTSVQQGIERLLSRVALSVRLVAALVGSVVAVVGAGAPADPLWLGTAVAGLLLWCAVFVALVGRTGLSRPLILGDLLVVALLCVAHRQLVPAAVLSVMAGTGWVDLVASSAVIIAQTGLRPVWGLAASLFVALAYAAGTMSIREMPFVLLLQGGLSSVLVSLLRRAGREADTALTEYAAERSEAATRAAVRRDEAAQQRLLHDTVLATLTTVGIGAVRRSSRTLRTRATADVAVISRIDGHLGHFSEYGAETGPDDGPGGTADGIADDIPAAGPQTVRLDLALRGAAADMSAEPPGVTVEWELAPLRLPPRIARALVAGAREALANVARHAGVGTVRVRAGRSDGVTLIEITDVGRGFDVDAVPAHRRGVRDSMIERMRDIGGAAHVTSEPGAGTTVLLRWPYDES